MSVSTISPHTALIYLMVLMSAADREMTDREVRRIGEIVKGLPVFENYDAERLVSASEECAAILVEENGFEAILGLVDEALPDHLTDTAYLVCCEIAIADRLVDQEELRLLDIVRNGLEVDRLTAAAIERAVVARNRVL